MSKKISAAELQKLKASGAKTEIVMRKPRPIAPEARQDSTLFSKALEAQGVALTDSMRELVSNLKIDRTPTTNSPTEWTFTVKRDSDNLLESIHAVAGNTNRTLQ